MSKRRHTAALAVAGLLVLLALALRWESAQHTITGLKSMCSRSATIDCDKVQASDYASLFGVSLSVWGMAGGLILLGWLIAAQRGFPSLLTAAAALCAFNLCAAAYLAYVSAFVIGAVCLYCTAMQICIVALAILVIPKAPRPQLERNASVLAATVVVLFIALAFMGEAYADHRSELLRLYRQEGGARLRVDVPYAPLMGDPGTPHSGLLFLDFGCPYCRACYLDAASLVRAHPRDIHFFVKHYPLDRECNHDVTATVHVGACKAAHAAAAATLRGGDDMALAYLFDQADFFPQVLDRLGDMLKIPREEWRALQRSPRVRDVVHKDILDGAKLDLNGVPAAYVDGRPVDAARITQVVRKLLGK